MLWRVRGSLTGARSAGTGHLARRYSVFIHTDHWTLLLELICISNSFIAMVIADKEYYMYVSHNVFCDIVVLNTPDFWLQ